MYTDEQIRKLAEDTQYSEGSIRKLLETPALVDISLNEVDYLLYVGRVALKLLLSRIEADEQREKELEDAKCRLATWEHFGRFCDLETYEEMCDELRRLIAGGAIKIKPDPLSLPAAEREWTIVDEGYKRPNFFEKVWTTRSWRGRRDVAEDKHSPSENIQGDAIAYMPRVYGEDPPPPYGGPIPAVKGWEGSK